MDLLSDYIRLASSRGYDPQCLVDARWYYQQYPDVAAAGDDPLVHYFAHGAAEGNDPNPLFNTSWYLQQYPDVAAGNDNALLHYVAHGAAEGCDPNPLFDTSWYLTQYAEKIAGINPLQHYLAQGALMLQQAMPDDYVLATGETHTVREFVENAFFEIGISLIWKGSGITEVGVDKNTGAVLVEVDPRYFRPTEVESLMGDASKAREKLGWQPKVSFRELVREMVQHDILALEDNKSIRSV
jgi:GDP-mannose 4,6 dehydratase